MNELIAKKALFFSLLFGAMAGLISLFPVFIGFCLSVLMLFAAPIVILYMKKDKKHLGIIDNQQGAVLGAIIGFFSMIGFFVTFAPMVCIIHLIYKKYYAYAIPDMIQTGAWLFFVLVFIVALVFAMTNSVSGMGCAFVLNYFEKKPQTSDAQLDITIDD